MTLFRAERRDPTNPYIALADVYMNFGVAFVCIALLFIFFGHRGWDDVRYREEHQRFATTVRNDPQLSEVELCDPRNDAPGEQRWRFKTSALFEGETARLSRQGRQTLAAFAQVMRKHESLWWRIRIEVHSRQFSASGVALPERRAFQLTSMRAVEITLFLRDHGIPPWKVVPSGRGFQDPLDRSSPGARVQDRVDILLIPPSVTSRKDTAESGESPP